MFFALFVFFRDKKDSSFFDFHFVFRSLNRNFGCAEVSRKADSFGEINLPSSQAVLRFRTACYDFAPPFGNKNESFFDFLFVFRSLNRNFARSFCVEFVQEIYQNEQIFKIK